MKAVESWRNGGNSQPETSTGDAALGTDAVIANTKSLAQSLAKQLEEEQELAKLRLERQKIEAEEKLNQVN